MCREDGDFILDGDGDVILADFVLRFCRTHPQFYGKFIYFRIRNCMHVFQVLSILNWVVDFHF